jgi:hypothetical protein
MPTSATDAILARHNPRAPERLARKAIALAGTPDAGIWTLWPPQTFSSLMSWAGADRMARVAACYAPAMEAEFRDAAVRIRDEIVARA